MPILSTNVGGCCSLQRLSLPTYSILPHIKILSRPYGVNIDFIMSFGQYLVYCVMMRSKGRSQPTLGVTIALALKPLLAPYKA